MFERFARWFSPPSFPSDEDKARSADLLNAILLVLMAFTVVGTAFILLVSMENWVFSVLFSMLLIVASLGLRSLMHRGHVRPASVILSIVLWLGVTLLIWFSQAGIRGALVSTYFLVVTMAGLLLGGGAVLVFGLLSLASLGILFGHEVSGLLEVTLAAQAAPVDLITVLLALSLTGLLLRLSVNRTATAFARARQNELEQEKANRELQAIRSSLERRVFERTRNLEAVARVAQAITTVLDPIELERQIVNLVRESFDLYYVGLFLVDVEGEWSDEPNRWIVLRAGTGEAGRQMIERGHRFALGDPDSMIARCVTEERAIIALDVGREARRFDNPLLPDTHSEMALPLISRTRVLGAITIQSDRVAAFSEAEISTMQTMADQVAGAVDNARSFASAREALARSQDVARRYVRESWEGYISTEPTSGYRYVPGRARIDNQAWLPVMSDVLRRRDLVTSQADQAAPDKVAEMAMPLLLGEEMIGTIGLRRQSARAWSQDEIELVRDVSAQVAQAVETRRLFEETQRSARREAALRRTADRVRSQANLDALLRTAVKEIQRAVGASHVAIRLGTEETLIAGTDRPQDQEGTA